MNTAQSTDVDRLPEVTRAFEDHTKTCRECDGPGLCADGARILGRIPEVIGQSFSPLRIVPAPSIAEPLGLVPELGDLIDSINQKLQVVMVAVEGNRNAEALIQQIAMDLRNYHRNTEPQKGRFAAVKDAVMMNSRRVLTACSHTMAKRAARALNNHRTNREGV